MKNRSLWIPAVSGLALCGATVVEGCVPIRGGSRGGGGDDDEASAEDITGTWALTRWAGDEFPYESSYQRYSYSSYSYETCEVASSFELSVEADGDVEWRSRQSRYGYCPYGYGPSTTVYDGRWTNPSEGVWRIEVQEAWLDMNCGPDGDTLECYEAGSGRLEFDRT